MTERLTDIWGDGTLDIYVKDHDYIAAAHKLAEYEDAEEQGLLVRLPCRVGDVVYTNTSMPGWYKRKKDRPYPATVCFIGLNGNENFFNVSLGTVHDAMMLQFKFSDIGKWVFLTREEAEQALMEGGK